MRPELPLPAEYGKSCGCLAALDYGLNDVFRPVVRVKSYGVGFRLLAVFLYAGGK